MSTIRITTIKSGQDYRVMWRGTSYRFMLNADHSMVAIYSPDHLLGLWKLERFENVALTPASIESFISAYTAQGPECDACDACGADAGVECEPYCYGSLGENDDIEVEGSPSER